MTYVVTESCVGTTVGVATVSLLASVVRVTALLVDLLPDGTDEAEARRIMTNMVLGSDSLLFGLLREVRVGARDFDA